MKKTLLLVLLLVGVVAPVMAQDDATEVETLRRALEQALRENVSLRAELEAARSEIDRLRGGRILPATTALPAAAPETGKQHTVRSGETLATLATRFYGSAAMYPKIFNANQGVLNSPDRIYPGQVLTIP